MKTKKKVFTRNGTLFSSNSSRDLRSDAHQNQIIGGDADEDHTQIIGGIYSPEPPRVLAPLAEDWQSNILYYEFLLGKLVLRVSLSI